MWEVIYEPIEPWLDAQEEETVQCVFSALRVLRESGPGLGRPLVDAVKGSAISNLKELRPTSPGASEIRILFVFDPKRRAILLVAGDKSQARKRRFKWSGWYRKAIAEAERIYQRYLEEEGAGHE